MKIVLSHPNGNQVVRNALVALNREGILSRYYTTVGWSQDNLLAKLAPAGLRKKLSRRSYAIPSKFIRNAPVREFLRLARPFGTNVTIDDVYEHMDRWVAGNLPRLKSQQEVTAVFAYEDGARDTFKAARELGLDCIYELPIGYWKAGQQMYHDEKACQPEWEATLTGLKDSAEKLDRKDEELAQADTVICASSFTKSTLKLYQGNIPSVAVIPFGAPRPIEMSEVRVEKGKRLRLLFVGGLSQRKGLSYLFDAVEALGDAVELTVIGQFVSEPPKVLEAHLRRCRYIPSLSHDDILKEMQQHDLFVFPSLFEGFALVLLEAMSRGLPCITTPNTAGPDIIDHGKDGFIVPIRSTAEIIACVEKVLADPDYLLAVKEAALAKAAFLNWEEYQRKFANHVLASCR